MQHPAAVQQLHGINPVMPLDAHWLPEVAAVPDNRSKASPACYRSACDPFSCSPPAFWQPSPLLLLPPAARATATLPEAESVAATAPVALPAAMASAVDWSQTTQIPAGRTDTDAAKQATTIVHSSQNRVGIHTYAFTACSHRLQAITVCIQGQHCSI